MAPVRKIESMGVEGTRKRGRSLKTWFEGVKKNMIDYRITKSMIFYEIEWREEIKKPNPDRHDDNCDGIRTAQKIIVMV